MMTSNISPQLTAPERLFVAEPDRPLAMLGRCPAHQPTPQHDLPELARRLGVAALTVKDETGRMGLGSFKALGGAFAVGQMIADMAGTTDLQAPAARAAAAGMTFITASAGNHGLSVAAGARVFGARAVIYLSASVPEGFAERIRAMGAGVERVAGTYEDSVATAVEASRVDGCYHLADGSWEGYTERPALVMEGYTVLADECRGAYAASGNWPTHILLQAGVGGFAAAFAAHVRDHWPVAPEIVIVEPDAAPCLKASIEAGGMTTVAGPRSNMGRLDCKDASLIALDSLRRDADRFVTVTDEGAVQAVQELAEFDILTTPSGAAGLAALPHLDLGADSRCLIVVTEGMETG